MLFPIIALLAISFVLQGANHKAEAAGPTAINTIDLGVGTFPDPVFYNGRIWVAVQQGPPGDYGQLNLYNFAPDLTDQKIISIPFSGVGRAFQRLAVYSNILWMVFRDGENSACVSSPSTCIPEHINLWRSDTGAIENLGQVTNSGNHPVAAGGGLVVWQNQVRAGVINVFMRDVTGGPVFDLGGIGAPTGISRVLPGGIVVLMDTDLTAVPWGVQAWSADPLIVASDVTPYDDNGVVGRFNDDPATEFNLWPNQTAHTPHAFHDGLGNYVVATWNPTVRVAAFNYWVGASPFVVAIDPTTAYPGQLIDIYGYDLTPNVLFTSSAGVQTAALGSVDLEKIQTTVAVPLSLQPGLYTVTLFGPGGPSSGANVLTIINSAAPIISSGGQVGATGTGSNFGTTSSSFGGLIEDIFKYGIYMLGLAVFVMIMWAGVIWMTAAGNSGKISDAKHKIFNAIIGAVILISGYTILNTINPALTKGVFNLPANTPVPSIYTGPPTQINACNQCSAYPGNILAGGQPVQCVGNYINVRNFSSPIPLNDPSRTCPFVELSIGPQLLALRQATTNWVMSEGFPPTVNHADACHGNGTCVDIRLTSPPSVRTQLAQEVDLLCAAVRQAGFSTIVNEYSSLNGLPYNWQNCPLPKSTPFQTGDHLHIEN
ncbi:MAG: hypothetical protein A3B99_00045 [Candidatus Yanofskybacteria bacterium RIFCSPHIGHO2_02_FULL_44_12b]|uniref:IPT/TIG domain-containing protein n=2 Tax=Candidatus Yanofskyibacteriota TaxID=1752733 RepID=A0A1F8GN50_9BACT|nr:MAG: hypothetical protein UW79_C0013G0027 [Candidatus Yanofskybacteria bacterium GW2011_GWA2_44_9]OGN04144.1 MAG: hypothetical protein A2659_01490 [Candidatus Yanofskybacteria bacterium RIFCSPHIGHO2_01_FULL_44_24]OGN14738.1 MAG: hypothetical protein A3B99_00045 [Candidatus Yanofskybacteria bacterium RIFCSPHIGHO2_02_FULL_44_12b]OGN25869.1 MAG: hypothetical protein A2925_02405 [Candidatus Yanofskybacteria bacterium RIFCSPLOWO2_01_FULL_44_22]